MGLLRFHTDSHECVYSQHIRDCGFDARFHIGVPDGVFQKQDPDRKRCLRCQIRHLMGKHQSHSLLHTLVLCYLRLKESQLLGHHRRTRRVALPSDPANDRMLVVRHNVPNRIPAIHHPHTQLHGNLQ